jgi:GT2 family glycosyltransferase
MPLVSIVIVNYNGAHLLERCLQSVYQQSYRPMEVILVDNSSSDASVDLVRSRFPEVRVVVCEHNLGFAGGNNAGVEVAKGQYVVLLNNDTQVEPEWLERLVTAVVPPTVAVASSLILTEGIPGRYYERNGSINLLGHNIMRKFTKPHNIFFAGGASMAFKKDMLGLPFDADYFAYAEDVYLSLRARFLGYEVVHAHTSVVHHIGSATAGRQPKALTTFLQERNRLLNLFLFFSWKTVLRALPLVFLNILGKLTVSLVSTRYSFGGLLRAYWWFMIHWSVVLRKRANMRGRCVVSDDHVTSWMTADLTNGESRLGRLGNLTSRMYHRLVGIRTLEVLPRESL